MAFWNKSQKSIASGVNLSVNDMDKILDFLIDGKDGDPWGSAYYKGIVKKIASTVRIIPRRFKTLNGDAVIEETDLPVKINVNNILAQSSIAVNRFGRAYWGLDTQGKKIVRARWFNPATIQEDIQDGKGLVGFIRQSNTQSERRIEYKYNPDTERVDIGDNGGLGWVWSLGMNEVGPGDTLDGDVGLPASLLQWSDLMMSALFQRGGINKWVAFTEQNPSPDDQKRIREKINRMLGKGVEGSSTFEVLSNLLEMKQVGTNPKDLEMEVVNTGNKADVSAASLTPQILINPDMASNRSVMDRITASWLNELVVPHAQLIVDGLNHHVFIPSGFVMELQPNAMGADQQDEVDRAQAWGIYVERGANPYTTAAMLGLEVPDGMDLMSGHGPDGVTGDIQLVTEATGDAINQDLVLNGAQITSAIQIVDAFSRGLFPREIAVNMIVRFFNIRREIAETLVPTEAQTLPQEKSIIVQQLEPSPEWKNERRQFKRWYSTRIGADISDFEALYLSDDDKTAVIAEVLKSDVWGGY